MFPSRCERCGGPQWWTFDRRGDTWTVCKDSECVDDQLVLPLIASELQRVGLLMEAMEPIGCQGVGTLESGDATAMGDRVESLEDPPQEFLDTLWEGDHAESQE